VNVPLIFGISRQSSGNVWVNFYAFFNKESLPIIQPVQQSYFQQNYFLHLVEVTGLNRVLVDATGQIFPIEGKKDSRHLSR
jgi:hypothetical protein